MDVMKDTEPIEPLNEPEPSTKSEDVGFRDESIDV